MANNQNFYNNLINYITNNTTDLSAQDIQTIKNNFNTLFNSFIKLLPTNWQTLTVSGNTDSYAYFLSMMFSIFRTQNQFLTNILKDINNINNVPSIYLPNLFYQFSLSDINFNIFNESTQRTILNNIISIYKEKGTYNSIIEFFSLLNQNIQLLNIFLSKNNNGELSLDFKNRDKSSTGINIPITMSELMDEDLLWNLTDSQLTNFLNNGNNQLDIQTPYLSYIENNNLLIDMQNDDRILLGVLNSNPPINFLSGVYNNYYTLLNGLSIGSNIQDTYTFDFYLYLALFFYYNFPTTTIGDVSKLQNNLIYNNSSFRNYNSVPADISTSTLLAGYQSSIINEINDIYQLFSVLNITEQSTLSTLDIDTIKSQVGNVINYIFTQLEGINNIIINYVKPIYQSQFQDAYSNYTNILNSVINETFFSYTIIPNLLVNATNTFFSKIIDYIYPIINYSNYLIADWKTDYFLNNEVGQQYLYGILNQNIDPYIDSNLLLPYSEIPTTDLFENTYNNNVWNNIYYNNIINTLNKEYNINVYNQKSLLNLYEGYGYSQNSINLGITNYSFTFNVSTTANNCGVLALSNNQNPTIATNFPFTINISASGQLIVNDNGNILTSNIIVNDGNFHNIRITVGNNGFTLYIDSSTQQNISTYTSSNIWNSNYYLNLLIASSNVSEYYDGYINQIKLSNSNTTYFNYLLTDYYNSQNIYNYYLNINNNTNLKTSNLYLAYENSNGLFSSVNNQFSIISNFVINRGASGQIIKIGNDSNYVSLSITDNVISFSNQNSSSQYTITNPSSQLSLLFVVSDYGGLVYLNNELIITNNFNSIPFNVEDYYYEIENFDGYIYDFWIYTTINTTYNSNNINSIFANNTNINTFNIYNYLSDNKYTNSLFDYYNLSFLNADNQIDSITNFLSNLSVSGYSNDLLLLEANEEISNNNLTFVALNNHLPTFSYDNILINSFSLSNTNMQSKTDNIVFNYYFINSAVVSANYIENEYENIQGNYTNRLVYNGSDNISVSMNNGISTLSLNNSLTSLYTLPSYPFQNTDVVNISTSGTYYDTKNTIWDESTSQFDSYTYNQAMQYFKWQITINMAFSVNQTNTISNIFGFNYNGQIESLISVNNGKLVFNIPFNGNTYTYIYNISANTIYNIYIIINGNLQIYINNEQLVFNNSISYYQLSQMIYPKLQIFDNNMIGELYGGVLFLNTPSYNNLTNQNILQYLSPSIFQLSENNFGYTNDNIVLVANNGLNRNYRNINTNAINPYTMDNGISMDSNYIMDEDTNINNNYSYFIEQIAKGYNIPSNVPNIINYNGQTINSSISKIATTSYIDNELLYIQNVININNNLFYKSMSNLNIEWNNSGTLLYIYILYKYIIPQLTNTTMDNNITMDSNYIMDDVYSITNSNFINNINSLLSNPNNNAETLYTQLATTLNSYIANLDNYIVDNIPTKNNPVNLLYFYNSEIENILTKLIPINNRLYGSINEFNSCNSINDNIVVYDNEFVNINELEYYIDGANFTDNLIINSKWVIDTWDGGFTWDSNNWDAYLGNPTLENYTDNIGIVDNLGITVNYIYNMWDLGFSWDNNNWDENLGNPTLENYTDNITLIDGLTMTENFVTNGWDEGSSWDNTTNLYDQDSIHFIL